MSKGALKRDDKGRLVKGTPPGPGRPKGSISIKDKVRKHLEENPEDVKEIINHFVKNNRELMWQMLEGRPNQQMAVEAEVSNSIELTDEQLTRIIRKRAEQSTGEEGS